MINLNKKIAVLLVVPILIAMGGTFAFSAFSGSSSITVNSTAGHMTWELDGHLIATNATNTPITVEGPNGMIYEIGVAEPYHHANGVYNLKLGSQYYNTLKTEEYTINVTNFAPGEYVEIEMVLTNNGTVGFVATPSVGGFHTSSNATYNPSGKSIKYMNVPASSFMADLESATGYIYNVSYQTPTSNSGFGASLSPEGTAIMDIWVGLGNSAGADVNHYQGSDFSFTVTVNVVSDP
ncbi:hypothetical protein [Picrophilus oshimae]|uniref:Uncharacterized protein n=1 Tax=Picrophilus torridus (strain ATCC 700027 / DSM 9790 / JCM 10055 / NBRC 100828 / KAW 2/3) TaxID=1122961 RepID=A0A8G2FVG1_PICTO|nr:hypothetical protein [Picrophilus oshimae]SMD30184.1 hypothetical protein SAMN02745355_0046 [Picrophilus oshimae DSM 9789]